MRSHHELFIIKKIFLFTSKSFFHIARRRLRNVSVSCEFKLHNFNWKKHSLEYFSHATNNRPMLKFCEVDNSGKISFFLFRMFHALLYKRKGVSERFYNFICEQLWRRSDGHTTIVYRVLKKDAGKSSTRDPLDFNSFHELTKEPTISSSIFPRKTKAANGEKRDLTFNSSQIVREKWNQIVERSTRLKLKIQKMINFFAI